MARLRLAWFCVAMILVAGCIHADTPETLDRPAPDDEPRITLANQTAVGSQPLHWQSPEMAYGDHDTMVLDVYVPEGYWDVHDGTLGIVISWDKRDGAWFGVNITKAGWEQPVVGGGFYAAVAVVPSPGSGLYTVNIANDWGLARYRAEAQIDSKLRGPVVRDLLPNLVTLPPDELWVGGARNCVAAFQCYNDRACIGSVGCMSPLRETLGVVGYRGCSVLEMGESAAKRCLRFSNLIGNAGEGPFQVVLKDEAEEVKAFAGQANWTQRIQRSDGSVREAEVGPAAYHVTHGHVHYQGMALYQVFAYDLAGMKRLEPVAESRKVGFCLIDTGVIGWDLPDTAAAWQVPGCSLMPNWWDLYTYALDDQYIEISGLPDGTYELVSTANELGTALESDTGDNSASTVFRLTGDEVELLHSFGVYRGAGNGAFPPES